MPSVRLRPSSPPGGLPRQRGGTSGGAFRVGPEEPHIRREEPLVAPLRERRGDRGRGRLVRGPSLFDGVAREPRELLHIPTVRPKVLEVSDRAMSGNEERRLKLLDPRERAHELARLSVPEVRMMPYEQEVAQEGDLLLGQEDECVASAVTPAVAQDLGGATGTGHREPTLEQDRRGLDPHLR